MKRTSKLVVCPVCQKEHWRYLSQIKKGAKYCSPKCAGKSQRAITSIEYGGNLYHLMPSGHYRSTLARKFLHHAVWESQNGPVPKDRVIHHIDGNPANNDIGNLQLMTLSEHAIEHQRRESPIIEIDGIRLTVIEWQKRLGLKKDFIQYRLRRGWDARKAILTPPMFTKS